MAVFRYCLPLILVAWAAGPAVGQSLPTGAVSRLTAGDVQGLIKFLAFSADGKQLIAVHTDGTLRVWDLATRKTTRSVKLPPGACALTPDRSYLVGIDDRLTVTRVPLASDRPPTTVPLTEARRLDLGLRPREVHVLPDGTLALLAAPDRPDDRLDRYCVSFWDGATGKLVRWGGDPGVAFARYYSALSPDGRFSAALEATFDTRTGTRRALGASPFGLGGSPGFSPDGRLLAITSRDTRVWEVATGRVVADLPTRSSNRGAFSLDGRRLASAGSDQVVVWDVGHRKAVVERPTPDPVGCLAFSPDGRTLATGDINRNILLWTVPGPVPEGRWSDADAKEAWEALAGDPSSSGYPVVWQLADYPADSVRFLRGQVAVSPAADPGELARLLARLDSPRFAEREAASKRLRDLGRAAEGALRQGLGRDPSPEQVARIEGVLAALEPVARPRGDDLRGVRAAAVLEHVGTDEARRVLAEWAERAASPTVADEAGRALARLKARK